MSVTNSAPLEERIGGRWAISWPAFLIGSVLIVILITLSGGTIGGQPVGDGERAPLLIISLAGAAGIGFIFWIGHLTAFRRRREQPVSTPRTISLHLLSGAVFGLILVIGSAILGVESDLPPAVRIASLAFAALWWCLTMSLVLEAADRFTSTRLQLINDVVSLELTAVADSEVSTGIRSTLARHRHDIRSEASSKAIQSLSELNSGADTVLDTNEWWRTSASLRTSGDSNSLREEFQRRLDPRAPIPGAFSVLREVLVSGRFAMIATSLVILIVSLPHAIVTSGPLQGTLMSLALCVVVALVLLLSNILLDRLSGVTKVVTYLASLIVVTGLVTMFIAWPARSSPAWDDLAAAAIVTLSVLVAASSLAPLDRVRARSLSVLRDHSSQQREYQRERMVTLADIAQSLASAVLPQAPSDLTVRLHACATGLYRASMTQDVERWRHALEWSAASLTQTLPEPVASVSSAVNRAIEPWVGFLDFEITIDPNLAEASAPGLMELHDAVRLAVEEVSGESTHTSQVTIQVHQGVSGDITTTWHRPSPEHCVVSIEVAEESRLV
jgi:hypothetical protein